MEENPLDYQEMSFTQEELKEEPHSQIKFIQPIKHIRGSSSRSDRYSQKKGFEKEETLDEYDLKVSFDPKKTTNLFLRN